MIKKERLVYYLLMSIIIVFSALIMLFVSWIETGQNTIDGETRSSSQSLEEFCNQAGLNALSCSYNDEEVKVTVEGNLEEIDSINFVFGDPVEEIGGTLNQKIYFSPLINFVEKSIDALSFLPFTKKVDFSTESSEFKFPRDEVSEVDYVQVSAVSSVLGDCSPNVAPKICQRSEDKDDGTPGGGKSGGGGGGGGGGGNGNPPACSNGVDDDGDGLIDFPVDPGCQSTDDGDETDEVNGGECGDIGDSDGDNICDNADSCPNDYYNDIDGDGVCGDIDNCPLDSNSNQVDSDGDGIGDACDVADFCLNLVQDIEEEGIDCGPICGNNCPKVIFEDYFNDGDYTDVEGEKGLSWTLIEGDALITDSDKKLGLRRIGNSTVISNQIMPGEYTLEFDIYVTYSYAREIILFYQDSENYYGFDLKTIYRIMDGEKTTISDPDFSNFMNLPHASGAYGKYKIYVKNDGTSINFKVDKGAWSNGVDFLIDTKDTNPQAVAKFNDGSIGFRSIGESMEQTPWVKIDNITVYDALKKDERPWPITDFYVDVNIGDDNNEGTQGNPFKSVQKAAYKMLAGDSAYIMPGLYREGDIIINSSGKNGYPISIIGANPSQRAVIDGAIKLDASAWTLHSENIYRTTIDWEPTSLYWGITPMFIAQDPNQEDPEDQLMLEYFMPVPFDENNDPAVNISEELKDSSYFTQSDPDYWDGASVLIYGGYGNSIGEYQVLDFIPSENKIVHEFDRWRVLHQNDKYAMINHLSILDKPGEWVINDNGDGTYEVYVWPYGGQNLGDIEIERKTTFLRFDSRFVNDYLNIENLEIRKFVGSGIDFSAQYGSVKHSKLNNLEVHHNKGSGIVSSYNSDDTTITNNYIYANYWNGISLGGRNNWGYLIENNTITKNLDNGVWMGGGFNGYVNGDVLFKNNNVSFQGSRRRHPDNIQIHQVKNVTFIGNYFEQEGHQNGWFQYSDEIYLINNVFKNGNLGVNSAIHSYLYNNVFDRAGIRYDAHIQNYPSDDPDFYAPQFADIKNNIIIQSSISMPPEQYWDAFHVGYNLYSHIDGSWGNWYSLFNLGEGSIGIDENTGGYFDSSYHLVDGSPLIDAGTSELSVGLKVDKENNRRYQGLSIDICPYEYPNSYSYEDCSNGIKDGNEDGVDCGGICVIDSDGDGYGIGMCSGQFDCNDNDPEINPGAEEICDEIDNNCDGVHHPDYYLDGDNDGANNCVDNCPVDFNSGQEDIDSDDVGNVCDAYTTLVDTFDERLNGADDINESKSPNGLAWNVLEGVGGVTISSDIGGKVLNVPYSGFNQSIPVLAVSTIGGKWNDYTYNMKVKKAWAPTFTGPVIFYKDAGNYYVLNLRGGLYKYVDGTPVLIASTSEVSFAHSENYYNNLTIKVYEEGNSLRFDLTKNGESSVSVLDNSPTWTSGSIGMRRESGLQSTYDWINVEVPAVCGNGIVDGNDVCDDGNDINNDECDNNCGMGGGAPTGSQDDSLNEEPANDAPSSSVALSPEGNEIRSWEKLIHNLRRLVGWTTIERL